MHSTTPTSLAAAPLLLALAALGCSGLTPLPPECGTPATRIHAIQGSGDRSALVGEEHQVEAVVTGRFPGLRGFYLQEEPADEDGDPATSEGLFIYEADAPLDVSVGDRVRVTGDVFEHKSGGAQLTELTSPRDLVVCGSGPDVPDRPLTLDPDAPVNWEALENMRVRFEGTVTATHEWARFGTLGLAHEHLSQPTQVEMPGPDALARRARDERARVRLDDGSAQPSPGLTDDVRSGDRLVVERGIVDQRFGSYRIQPTRGLDFAQRAPRPERPRQLEGDLRIATFNVRNWFHTLDTGSRICGPSQSMACRGAESEEERDVQRTKLGAVLRRLDADIVALEEIENGPPEALAALQRELGNDYTAIETGSLGRDAIRVALLFRHTRVQRVGEFEILDDSVDPDYIERRNRPVVAQTFEMREGGARLTVAVNHWKSKGSTCSEDPDAGDGQGRCNKIRTFAAQALLRWLASDPTGSGDPDFLVLGDLNSYRLEDPVRIITDAGYTDLPARFEGEAVYTSAFDGRVGALDHALASQSLASQATDATVWHINADVPPGIPPDASTILGASDHDPVLVAFDLTAP